MAELPLGLGGPRSSILFALGQRGTEFHLHTGGVEVSGSCGSALGMRCWYFRMEYLWEGAATAVPIP